MIKKNNGLNEIYTEKCISLSEEPFNSPLNNQNRLSSGITLNNNLKQKSSKLSSFKKDNNGQYLCILYFFVYPCKWSL